MSEKFVRRLEVENQSCGMEAWVEYVKVNVNCAFEIIFQQF